MEQAPAILVMERLDALWEASAQALDVAIFVDFFTTPFQPTPIFFPTFFPALQIRVEASLTSKMLLHNRKILTSAGPSYYPRRLQRFGKTIDVRRYRSA